MDGLVEDGSKDGRWPPGIDSCGGGSRGSRGSWGVVVLLIIIIIIIIIIMIIVVVVTITFMKGIYNYRGRIFLPANWT